MRSSVPLLHEEVAISELFHWNSSQDVGVREMNEEHKKMIGLMNQLHEYYLAKAPHET